MPTVLPEKQWPVEESTFAPTITFRDDKGELVTPGTATWTLTDKEGTVINSREDESITPATIVQVVLSGDDLALTSAGEDVGADEQRRLLIEATYDSTLGSDLPFRDELRFGIQALDSYEG